MQERPDASKPVMTAGIPVGMQDTIDSTLAALIASGQAERAMKAGQRAPSFRLQDAAGRMIRSVDLLRVGALVIAFHRGAWCQYCEQDLKALEAGYREIRSFGASLVAVSPQTPQNNCVAQNRLKISFPMLSDKGGALAQDFGIRFALLDSLRPVFGEMKVDLSALNGESSWTLPMPARFVISRHGMIAYSEVNPDYTQRPEPSELFSVLKHLA